MSEKVTNDEAQEILEEIEDNIDSEIITKFILLIILFLTSLPQKRIWTKQTSGVLLVMHHLLHSLKVNHYFLS
jgi:hypothetical protein